MQRSYPTIQPLLDALREALPGLPGFRSLSIYGSVAEGRADEYSDIDTLVITDDPPNAAAHLLGLLELIGPIEFSWATGLYPGELVHTVAFRDEGYYRRLDLALAEASAERRTIPGEQTILTCDESGACARTGIESSAYAPEYGSMGHFLLGQFLGCLRYVKARKRGRAMSCYRFAVAAADWSLTLQYARLTGDPHFRSKLTTLDYLEIDRLLSADDCGALLSARDFSSLDAMDRTVRAAADRMLDDGLCLSDMLDEVLPVEVFERIRGFLADELSPA